jgi:hypothetical protein
MVCKTRRVGTLEMSPVLACTIVDRIASLVDLQNRYSPLRLPIVKDGQDC